MFRVIVVLALSSGVLWELWSNVADPFIRCVRRYGWRKGIGFYRYMQSEAERSPRDPDAIHFLKAHTPH